MAVLDKQATDATANASCGAGNEEIFADIGDHDAGGWGMFYMETCLGGRSGRELLKVTSCSEVHVLSYQCVVREDQAWVVKRLRDIVLVGVSLPGES